MRSPAKARLAQLNSAGFKLASLAVLTLASGRRFFTRSWLVPGVNAC